MTILPDVKRSTVERNAAFFRQQPERGSNQVDALAIDAAILTWILQAN
jgi:hypothetical protein